MSERESDVKRKNCFSIEAILGLSERREAERREEERRAEPQSPDSTRPTPEDRHSMLAFSGNKSLQKRQRLALNDSSNKSKRVRTIFTPDQLERLEREFSRQQYMVGPERLYLASSLGLSEAQVKVWFQNRRIKWRKQHLESAQNLMYSTIN